MVARGEGRVLVTASIAAKAPGPFQATYAASKAFVHSFAEAIRYELDDTGVSVTSLMPGATDTDFFERADMEDTAVATGAEEQPGRGGGSGLRGADGGASRGRCGSLKEKLMTAGSGLIPDPLAAQIVAGQTRPGSG